MVYTKPILFKFPQKLCLALQIYPLLMLRISKIIYASTQNPGYLFVSRLKTFQPYITGNLKH